MHSFFLCYEHTPCQKRLRLSITLGQTCHIRQLKKVAIELPNWSFEPYFLCGLQLLTLAVSRTRSQTAIASFQHFWAFGPQTLAVALPLLSHLVHPWWNWCFQTADLCSLMATFQHCDLKQPTLTVSLLVFFWRFRLSCFMLQSRWESRNHLKMSKDHTHTNISSIHLKNTTLYNFDKSLADTC